MWQFFSQIERQLRAITVMSTSKISQSLRLELYSDQAHEHMSDTEGPPKFV